MRKNPTKPPTQNRTLLSLSLITLITNATYSTIAPILPLEIDAHSISQKWLSVIFLAYPVGYCVASPLLARWFKREGTVNVMIFGLVMVGLLFVVESMLFDVPPFIYIYNNEAADCKLLIGLLTIGQFALGASMSFITTGYYSLVTLLFVDVESAMSCIESAVGTGYILGPVLGSMLYDALGFRWAYRGVGIVVLVMAFVTWKYLRKYLVCKRSREEEGCKLDEIELETQIPLVKSLSTGQQHDIENYQSADFTSSRHGQASKMSCNRNEMDLVHLEAQDPPHQNNHESNNLKRQPTTLTLLATPKITTAALSITWISASWSFLEPILAKRLVHFQVQKRGIGLMFALSNIVYVPTAFGLQYLPKWMEKHFVIALSMLATPLAVLLVGNDSFWLMTTGIMLLGFLPTPVWIFLLPSMQEDAAALFSSDQKRCVNDLTAGVYNLFITLGQIVGYVIGPLVNQSYGVVMTTRIVAGFILAQAIINCVGVVMFGGRVVRWQRKRKRKGRYFVRYI
jgi:MFS family permease